VFADDAVDRASIDSRLRRRRVGDVDDGIDRIAPGELVGHRCPGVRVGIDVENAISGVVEHYYSCYIPNV